MARTNPKSRLLTILTLFLSVSLVAACGDDDGGSASGGGGEPASAGEQAGGAEGECAGTNLTFENLDTGVTGTATKALATRDSATSPQYYTHVADFDIAEVDLTGWRPEVPEGNNVITIQTTVFINDDSPEHPPLEAGATIEGGELILDTITFLVRHFDAENDWNQVINGPDVGGEMTVTSVGDTFCFEVDYQDQDKKVSGTVEAPVFRVGP